MKITDIAKLAKTSTATVSRALNNDPRVKEETKRRILDIVKQTGYKRNTLGRNLRKMRSGNILAILPTILNPIYSRIIDGVERRAKKFDYGVIIAVSHRKKENERKQLEMLQTKEVDGAITFVTSLDEQYLEKIALQYPLVLCAGFTQCENVSYTCINNEKAVYDGMKYLLSLGHKRIACINHKFSKVYELQRKIGYEKALKEAKLPIRPEYMIMNCTDYIDGYNYAKKLMELPEPPTAIFAFSDKIASGCIKYLNEIGVKVGVEVDVMGFDNIEIGEIITPTLTTINQPLEEMGMVAFDILYEKIKNIETTRKAVIMDHKLIIRQSTRPMKNRT